MLVTHDLAHEFPEMKDTIHKLKSNDNHFRRLFDEYGDVTKELHRGGEGAGAISDEKAEELKKRRLALKDEMFVILKKADGGCGTDSCGCNG